MATTSPVPTPNAAPAEPAPTAPPLGEVDKIILQDMLAERAKLRDAIPDSIKYAGIALVGMIAFVVNAKYEAAQSRSAEQAVWHDTKLTILLVFVSLLMVGFAFKVDEMTKRLKTVNEAINQKIKPWSVKIDDKSIISYGKFVIVFTLVFTALFTYIGWRHSQTSAINHPEKPPTVAPNKP